MKFTEFQKNKFINDCLIPYARIEGIKIGVVIDNEEEEEYNIRDAMYILFEYFNNENPELDITSKNAQILFDEYLFGDYRILRNLDFALVTIVNGKKRK